MSDANILAMLTGAAGAICPPCPYAWGTFFHGMITAWLVSAILLAVLLMPSHTGHTHTDD